MTELKFALSIEEAADYTGIGRNTLRNLVEWEKLPILRVGRKILIRRERLDEFLILNEGKDLRDRLDCQHFFRQIFLGYFSDIVQAFDTLRKNVCGDDYTSLHNPIVLSSVLPAYGMFHSIQILFL